MDGGVNFWTNCCHFTGCPKKTELIKVVSYKFRFLLSYFKIIQRRYQTIKFNNQGTKFLNISAWDCLMSLPNQPLFLRLMRTRVPTPYFLMCVRSWSRERKINTILNEPVLLLSNRHLSMILLLHIFPLNFCQLIRRMRTKTKKKKKKMTSRAIKRFDFALKSKLWPGGFFQHCPNFAGNSLSTGISQLRAGKNGQKGPAATFRPKGVCPPIYTGLLWPITTSLFVFELKAEE